MLLNPTQRLYPKLSLPKPLDWLPPGWLQELPDLLVALYRILRPLLLRLRWSHSPYEVLSQQVTLELLDRTGKRALYTKAKKIRLLQDGVNTVLDHAWGDGQPLRRYWVTPGRIGPRFAAGSRIVTPIVLAGTKSKGDVVALRVRRLMEDGFVKRVEWLEAEVSHPTKQLRLQVLFPKSRPCKWARLIERYGGRVLELGKGHIRYMPRGRQSLTYKVDRPRLYESYTLQWAW